MKKSQGLSLTTIIIAALVLIVLVLLILIFTGRINMFRSEVETCDGLCQNNPNCGDGSIGYYQFPCREDTSQTYNTDEKYCCPS